MAPSKVPAGRERADVQLVDHGRREVAARASRRRVQANASWSTTRDGPCDAVGLPGRARVGQRRAAVEAERVVGARPGARRPRALATSPVAAPSSGDAARRGRARRVRAVGAQTRKRHQSTRPTRGAATGKRARRCGSAGRCRPASLAGEDVAPGPAGKVERRVAPRRGRAPATSRGPPRPTSSPRAKATTWSWPGPRRSSGRDTLARRRRAPARRRASGFDEPELGQPVVDAGQQPRRRVQYRGLRRAAGAAGRSRPAGGCPGRPGSGPTARCPGRGRAPRAR